MTEAALEDWRTAPLEDRLRAVLGFLEKLTLEPDEVSPEDAEAVRRAGVEDDAIVDAIYVAGLFNMIDRMADALGFAVPPAESFARRAERMLGSGYELLDSSATA